jgi:hypothetical protein
LIVTDNSGNVAGSNQTTTLSGTGITSTVPSVVSVSPSSGTGFSQTFTAVYSDPNGINDLKTAHLLFTATTSS